MDIKETGKKLKPFAPVLSVALVTACVAGSLSGYEAPVYAATQEETPAKKEETKEKKEEKKTAAKGSFNLEDGVYKGTGTGYAGDITVSVLIKDKQIVSIDILSSSDDAAFFTRAKAVIDKVIEGQTLDVDTVSGATFSSRGIIRGGEIKCQIKIRPILDLKNKYGMQHVYYGDIFQQQNTER